jgi:hypothetical protein
VGKIITALSFKPKSAVVAGLLAASVPAPPLPPPVVEPVLPGPFFTVAAGAEGSGRLLDITAEQLDALKRGSVVWVESVKDRFRWDPDSTQAADNVTVCNPTVNGTNAGRLFREEYAAPEWMNQQNWYIDEANTSGLASDENTGASSTLPLRSELERDRRMGQYPKWTKSEYHLRYTSDVTNPVRIKGSFTTTTGNIWVHGNLVNGQGKAVLASLTVNTLVAMDQTTNTPLKFTSTGITTSWTADGLLNQRCRMTSGAGLGGYVWPALDLGSKQAHMTETVLPAGAAFTTPFTFPFTAFTPAQNDTFVVESLVQMNLFVTVLGSGAGNANCVIVDSVQLNAYVHSGTAQVCLLGCNWQATGSPTGLCKAIQCSGVRFKPGSLVSAEQFTLFSCYVDDSASGRFFIRQGGCTASSIVRFMTVQRQGVRVTSMVPNSGNAIAMNINSGFGIFNNTAGPGLDIVGYGHFNSTQSIWGVCAAGGTPLHLGGNGSRLTYGAAVPGAASYFRIDCTLAPSGAWISYKGPGIQVTAPAFDAATSTFTSYRTLTAANIQAALGSGGLNGQWFDPVTGCGMAAA